MGHGISGIWTELRTGADEGLTASVGIGRWVCGPGMAEVSPQMGRVTSWTHWLETVHGQRELAPGMVISQRELASGTVISKRGLLRRW